MAVTSIRENIRLAMKTHLETLGYKILDTSDKWNTYLAEADYPVAKIMFNLPSRVVQRFVYNKKQRRDQGTIIIQPWCDSDNFEEITSLEMESMDKNLNPDVIRALLPVDIQPKLGKILVEDMQMLIPDGSNNTSVAYACVQVTFTVEYIN